MFVIKSHSEDEFSFVSSFCNTSHPGTIGLSFNQDQRKNSNQIHQIQNSIKEVIPRQNRKYKADQRKGLSLDTGQGRDEYIGWDVGLRLG